MGGARIRQYDKKLYKKCIKCRRWRPREDLTVDSEDGSSKTFKRAFGRHEGSTDGLQSICMSCKNVMSTAAREKNVTQRIRHHTGTRCLTQLGDLAPKNFVADLEKYLGYRIATLVKHLSADLKEREGKTRKLRDALQEGYHIDHKIPLSSYQIFLSKTSAEGLGQGRKEGDIDWEEFEKCWAMDNLRAIPADENLAKGAKVTEESTDGADTTETDAAGASATSETPDKEEETQGDEVKTQVEDANSK